jgi:DMSO reductase anchor subunit
MNVLVSEAANNFKAADVALVASHRETVWGWRATINFTFGSAGAGLYLTWMLLQIGSPGFKTETASPFAVFAAAGFVVLGLLAVAGETHRPQRVRYLLSNLRRSWMSRETAAAVLFVAASILSWRLQNPIAMAIAGSAAIAFIISQGFILYQARAVPAWNTRWLPALFITSGLTSGAGLLLALGGITGFSRPDGRVLSFILLCSAADVIVWSGYINGTNNSFRAATELLRRPIVIFWLIFVFRLCPMIAILIMSTLRTEVIPPTMLTIAGCFLFAGTWAQKSAIIPRCGYLRAIKLRLVAVKSAR